MSLLRMAVGVCAALAASVGTVAACSSFAADEPIDERAAEAAVDAIADVVPGSMDARDAAVETTVGCEARKHTFCDDFDHESLGALWTTNTQTGGATLALTDAALSPPFALVTDLPPATDGGERDAVLTKSFLSGPGAPIRVFTVELDMRADAVLKETVTYFRIVFRQTALNAYAVGLASDRTKLFAFEATSAFDGGGYTQNEFPVANATFQAWRHVRLVLTLSQPASFVLSVDGTTASGTLSPPPFTELRVDLGITGVTAGAGPVHYFVDNVIVDQTP